VAANEICSNYRSNCIYAIGHKQVIARNETVSFVVPVPQIIEKPADESAGFFFSSFSSHGRAALAPAVV
jgi:hypothetical protein